MDEPVIPEPSFISYGGGKAIGQQNSSIDLSPLHAETLKAETIHEKGDYRIIAEEDYDVSTGIRFHPLSILISSLVKLILILALGPPVIAVLISEILLNATSMFNHSNWYIPKRLDAVLRLILVTPDVHRVHHSTNPDEHGNNFGFNFPWWDRLFGTYKAQPTMGHDSMQIGIEDFNDRRSIEFFPALAQPFNDEPTSNSALS